MGTVVDFCKRHKILTGIAALPLVLVLALLIHARGPYHGYRADAVKPEPGSAAEPGTLRAGVAKRDITPNLMLYDKFVDTNGNNKYDPEDGDYFEDTNQSGEVEAVWIAGFGNNRPAQGVHDPLWARAIAFENNGVRVVMVTVDSIGIFHEKILEMRHMLNPALDVDHLMVSCLHDHEAPDTMGIWSVGLEKPYWRWDQRYMEQVQEAVVEAAEEAVSELEPAEAILAKVEAGPEGYMDDSRKPLVYDNVVRCARFVRPGTDETIATLVNWGNHPETLGGSNPLLTSDFSHYWREGVEKGVPDPHGVEGLGGMCLYFQGMVGGLMTQLHTDVPDRRDGTLHREDTFEKAQNLGENLAILTVNALRGEDAWKMESGQVALAARTVFIKPKPLFGLGVFLGLVHPGWYWGKVRTEINAFRIGEIEMLTTPGELYPEIGLGGITAPAGQDFPLEPVEVPPLITQMNGGLKMIIGLANDELGYIIPKSQWDVEPPYAYGRTKSPQYGEENSFGPEVAPALHRASLEVLDALHQACESMVRTAKH